MDIQQIRQITAYEPKQTPTQKEAARHWFNSIHKQYPLSLTLTLHQCLEITNVNGMYYKKIDKEDVRKIALKFTQKLNKQIFGNSAKRYGKGLKYIIVMEGERSFKNLHLHMAIGGIPSHMRINKFGVMVSKASSSIVGINVQQKVDVTDSGWTEYISKELGKQDTDNVFWDLA